MGAHDAIRRSSWSALVVLLLAVAGTASEAPVDTSAAVLSGTATPTVAVPDPTRTAPAPRRAPSAQQATTRAVPVSDATLRPVRSDRRTVPARLDVAGVGISLPVVPVGVRRDRSMELPETVREVGWYRFGARPGDRDGHTVLAAHVDTVAEGVGPFAKLAWVSKGTRMALTDQAGRITTYRVISVELIAKSKVPLDRVFARDGAARLVILTCGGDYDRGTGYRDNVIVTAAPD